MALSTDTWITIIFYTVVILLLVIYRKKFEFQGKIIALRRLKFGITFMQKLAKKHQETFKLLGYAGIGIGLAGMIFMLYTLGDAFINLFLLPDAPAAVAPLIPGVNIPGSPLNIPLWVIIPLFFVVLIHEAGHGLVAKAHKIPIVSTGIVFFGPIVGAFVEPDEKKLKKASDVVKLSVFAAGPFFNALSAFVVFIIMFVAINPLTNAMVTPQGFVFDSIQEGFPAEIAGVQSGVVYDQINGVDVFTVEDMLLELQDLKPGDEVSFGNQEGEVTVITTTNPQDETKAYIGVLGIQPHFENKPGIPNFLVVIMSGISLFLFWVFILSIGLGAFNLLPLGPVDGGQMSRLSFTRMYGEKKGILLWGRISMLLFMIILALLIVPIFRAVIA
jgi:membrane-associated protease RseP (regulator of RpoE activity)